MTCITDTQFGFRFISSYQGVFSYEATIPNGRSGGECVRLMCRVERQPYIQPATISEADWELQVNGKLGMVTCYPPELLTNEFVAAFNQWLFAEWQRDVSQIAKFPEIYGPYEGGCFQILVGGKFEVEKGWTPLQSKADVAKLAGLPFGSVGVM
ncbi:hypothetical protein [Pseudomonas mohnii]